MNHSTRHILTSLVLLLALPLVSFAQQEGEDSGLEAANALAAILKNTRTLQADVQQLTLDQYGREIQEFQARLVMEKPDHFYWETLSPYQEIMLTDGTRIWRFEQDLEQLSIDPFDDDVSRTPILLLNGDSRDITASYTVSSFREPLGSITRFVLKPIATDSLFDRLSLTFDGDTLTEMQFEDSLGQKTSLSFSGIQVNAVIDPAVFLFKLPAGMDNVEIIDNTGI